MYPFSAVSNAVEVLIEDVVVVTLTDRVVGFFTVELEQFGEI